MTAPLIGLTTLRSLYEHNRLRDSMSIEYSDAVVRAGGLPVLIPLAAVEQGNENTLRAIYDRLDGILLPGGGDIHPECYGETLTIYEYGISRSRDKAELLLARWAYEDDRPLLGICRGQQAVNVALGGTLVHDIGAQLNGKGLTHSQEPYLSRSRLAHEVEVRSESRLAQILGCQRVPVNSLHHQAVHRLAESLAATAFADDGVIEAVEAPSARFYVAVQWHPEYLLDNVPAMQNLFARFVQACLK